MNYINVQNQVCNVFATAFVGVIVLFGTVAMPQFARADDYGFSYYEPAVSSGGASDFGCCTADYGYSYYEPAPAPTPTPTPDYGYSYYEPNTPATTPGTPDYGYSYYEPNIIPGTPPTTGTYEPYGGTYEPYGGTYQTYGGTYEAYATSPVYDYGSSYATNYGYGSNYGYNSPMSYPISYSYPSYGYQTPSYVTAPTTINSPTSINAPTNTCSAPNTCNTNVDDHSVFNAPTIITNPPANNVIVAPVNYATPQYNVQAYIPPPAQPSCSITLNTSGYNYSYGSNQAVLSWSSNNATNAYISPAVGSVSTSGSITVYPSVNQIYIMTVTGQGGVATCQTYASYSNYNYVAPVSPYVALTQIPYTGFDFGPFGNAMYWIALAVFAVAGAYLVVYYLPGIFSNRGSNLAFAGMPKVVASTVKTEARAGSIDELPVKSASVSSYGETQFAPISHTGFGTSDLMTVIRSAHGVAPRIVISRS